MLLLPAGLRAPVPVSPSGGRSRQGGSLSFFVSSFWFFFGRILGPSDRHAGSLPRGVPFDNQPSRVPRPAAFGASGPLLPRNCYPSHHPLSCNTTTRSSLRGWRYRFFSIDDPGLAEVLEISWPLWVASWAVRGWPETAVAHAPAGNMVVRRKRKENGVKQP